MKGSRITHRSIGAAALTLTLVASACGSSGESSLEQLIENETGEDVDIDLGGDGGISFESDEGSFTIDEEGNIVITDESGEVITGDIDIDGDGGFSLESEDGSFTVDEEGNFVVTDEDSGQTVTGQVSGNDSETGGEANASLDEDGEFQITDEEGNVTVSAGSDFPDEWPADVPRPEGLDVTSNSVFSGDQGFIIVEGMVAGDANSYIEAYGATLEGAGIANVATFTQEGDFSGIWENDSYTVTVNALTVDGETRVNFSVTTK